MLTYLPTKLAEWTGEHAWLWQFGRGKPRVGGLSVADTEDRRIAVLQDGATRKRGHAMLTERTHTAAAAHCISFSLALPICPSLSLSLSPSLSPSLSLSLFLCLFFSHVLSLSLYLSL